MDGGSKRTVVVDGSKVKLEKRVCACGCGCVFWVMPKSAVMFANAQCANKAMSYHWLEVHRRRSKEMTDEPSGNV